MSMHDEYEASPRRRGAPPPGVRDAEAVDLQDSPIKIREFLESILKDPDTISEVEIALSFWKGGDETRIEGYQLGFEQKVEDVVEEILDDVGEYVEEQHLKGKCTFYLRLADRKPRLQFKVRVISKFAEHPDFEEFEGEPPTNKGIVAQTQRHTEIAYHTLINGIQQSQTHTGEQMQDLRNENKQLRKENHDLIRERQEVLDMQFRRNLEYQQMEREQERKDKMMAGVVAAVMAFIETIARNKGEREALNTLQSFFSGLSPEHKMAVFTALPPEKQNELAGVLQQIMQPSSGGGGQGMLGSLMSNLAENINLGGGEPQGPSGPPLGPIASSPAPGSP